jgi:peptidoglycan/xylan/chitin deacetylase (PgdA/CDA1 family)
MSQRLTVLMYHYVRPLGRTRYPQIKGLDLELFRQQLAYVARHYHVVTMQEVIAAFWSGGSLPEKAALLTFDDGFLDHYTYVFPLLDRLGVQGSFYVPVASAVDRLLLDAHMIHFILASASEKDRLLKDVFDCLDHCRTMTPIEDNESLYKKYAQASRWDPPEIIFVKRLLQRGLAPTVQSQIIETLFDKYVHIDPSVMAEELYMTIDQIRTMSKHGMHIGAHGNSHSWLTCLARDACRMELRGSYEFLKSVGADAAAWTMSYPYGDYSQEVMHDLAALGCKLAFTVRPAVADVEREERYEIPRLDTNDLPQQATAETGQWYDLG